MNDYKEYVEHLASTATNLDFFNSSPFHAAIVMSRIFKYSKQKVRIYNGGFSGSVSNDNEYLSELSAFLERKGMLEVIVESEINPSSKVVPIFKKHKDQVTIHKINPTVRVIDTDNNSSPVHFTIGDNRMMRIEFDTNNYSAKVNFNDTTECEPLITLFDRIFNKQSTSLAI